MTIKENSLLEPSSFFNIEFKKQVAYDGMIPNHYHNHYEINYLLSGDRYFFINDKAYHLESGSVVLINANVIHHTTYPIVPKLERVIIEFKKEFIADFINHVHDIDLFSCFSSDIHILKLDYNDQNFFETILFKMSGEKKKQRDGFNTYQKILLIELLLFLNRGVSKVKKNKKSDHLNSKYKKMAEIVDFINNNYMKELTLSFVAKTFYVNNNYLSKSFKGITGFTFIKYLNLIRIKKAQELLMDSKLNITQISEAVGYENLTHFGRVFKTITGISPLNYRNFRKNK